MAGSDEGTPNPARPPSAVARQSAAAGSCRTLCPETRSRNPGRGLGVLVVDIGVAYGVLAADIGVGPADGPTDRPDGASRPSAVPCRRPCRCQCGCSPFGAGSTRRAISLPSVPLAFSLNSSANCSLTPYVMLPS